MTAADYRPYLQGCYSESIDRELDQMRGVERDEVKIGGEKIPTIKVETAFSCSLSDDASEITESVVDRFGEASPPEVQKTIFNLEAYSETGSGEAIIFSDLID